MLALTHSCTLSRARQLLTGQDWSDRAYPTGSNACYVGHYGAGFWLTDCCLHRSVSAFETVKPLTLTQKARRVPAEICLLPTLNPATGAYRFQRVLGMLKDSLCHVLYWYLKKQQQQHQQLQQQRVQQLLYKGKGSERGEGGRIG